MRSPRPNWDMERRRREGAAIDAEAMEKTLREREQRTARLMRAATPAMLALDGLADYHRRDRPDSWWIRWPILRAGREGLA
jgi:hypothetical protein